MSKLSCTTKLMSACPALNISLKFNYISLKANKEICSVSMAVRTHPGSTLVVQVCHYQYCEAHTHVGVGPEGISFRTVTPRLLARVQLKKANIVGIIFPDSVTTKMY